MLLRLMFVLLIALNIAVGAWLLLGDTGTHAVDATDAGVPKLKLLAELPASASTVALAEATTTGGAGGMVTMPLGATPAVPARVGSSALAAGAPSAKALSVQAPTAVPATAQSPATQPVAVPAARLAHIEVEHGAWHHPHRTLLHEAATAAGEDPHAAVAG